MWESEKWLILTTETIRRQEANNMQRQEVRIVFFFFFFFLPFSSYSSFPLTSRRWFSALSLIDVSSAAMAERPLSAQRDSIFKFSRYSEKV